MKPAVPYIHFTQWRDDPTGLFCFSIVRGKIGKRRAMKLLKMPFEAITSRGYKELETLSDKIISGGIQQVLLALRKRVQITRERRLLRYLSSRRETVSAR